MSPSAEAGRSGWMPSTGTRVGSVTPREAAPVGAELITAALVGAAEATVGAAGARVGPLAGATAVGFGIAAGCAAADVALGATAAGVGGAAGEVCEHASSNATPLSATPAAAN